MCFSSPASFTASAALFTVGVVAIAKSKTTPQRVFASMPLIFAVQQFTEGWLWFAEDSPHHYIMHNFSMYTFLVFAQIVWPVFVPLSILLLEQNLKRRKILNWLLTTGLFTSVYLGYCMVFYKTTSATEGHHIKYVLGAPGVLKIIGGVPYLVSTILAPLVSSSKSIKLFGLVLLVSYIVSGIFYEDYLLSVWCYFAAVLSALVLVIIIRLNSKSNSALAPV